MPAAVLFPLFFKDQQPYLLFTKRTDKVEHHKNQISLPGGRHDPQDRDLLQTALRETQEEIGVDPSHIEILGQTDHFLTNTHYLVTPFVGVMPYPYDFKISDDEIDYLIEAPLLHLLDERHFKTRMVTRDGVRWQLHYYHFNGEEIWGVTGLKGKDLESAFIRPFSDVQQAIDKALEAKGKQAKILFLMDGSHTVPKLTRN